MRVPSLIASAILICVVGVLVDSVYRREEDVRKHPVFEMVQNSLVHLTSLANNVMWERSEQAAAAKNVAHVTTTSKLGSIVPTSPIKDALKPAVPEIALSLQQRNVKKVLENREQPEGMNAKVRRSIGSGPLPNLDPILLLDHFTVAPPAGFPDHFHRGFETVTFILPESKNTVNHEDFAGHEGEIGPGDVQWMTAGRGIVHAEMPGQKTSEPAVGIQLWVNLAKKNKMVEPRYQELLGKDIPTVVDEKGGVSAYIIAGSALGVSCKIQTLTPTHYIYYTLNPGAELKHVIPKHWNSFLYTLSGTVSLRGERSTSSASGAAADSGSSDCPDLVEPLVVKPFHTIVFDRSITLPAGTSPIDAGVECEGDVECDVITVKANANPDGRPSTFILVAAEPLHEPIVQHGPVVMNSRLEVHHAYTDYASRTNGFERAKDFRSKIAHQ